VESQELRKLAEENLAFILQRARENQGRITQEDLAAGSLFCRVAEAETNGSPYAGAGALRNWNGDTEHAAAALGGSLREPRGR